MSFKATFNPPLSLKAQFNEPETLTASFGSFMVVPVADYYDGDYSITPSTQEQVVPIIGKTARQDIVVGAIPSNYGLITWNGSTLTVS